MSSGSAPGGSVTVREDFEGICDGFTIGLNVEAPALVVKAVAEEVCGFEFQRLVLDGAGRFIDQYALEVLFQPGTGRIHKTLIGDWFYASRPAAEQSRQQYQGRDDLER